MTKYGKKELKEEEKEKILNDLEISQEWREKINFDEISNYKGVGLEEFRLIVGDRKMHIHCDYIKESASTGEFQNTLFDTYSQIRNIYEIVFAKEIIQDFIVLGYLVNISYVDVFLDSDSYEITPLKYRLDKDLIEKRKKQVETYRDLYNIKKIEAIFPEIQNYSIINIELLNKHKKELEELDKIRKQESEDNDEISRKEEERYLRLRLDYKESFKKIKRNN